MKFISISDYLLPVPDSWEMTVNGRSYSGVEGLLDPRVVPKNSEINEERLQVALAQLREKGGSAELMVKNGEACLFCSYHHSGCLVNTFTLPMSDGVSELNAVYAFNPGNAAAAEEIKRHVGRKQNEAPASQ